MKRSMATLLLGTALAACGGGDGGGADIDSPCDLADAAMVQEAFGGTVAAGVEGGARNCEFEISGGPVESLSVFHFGEASSFDGVRSGFEDNRGGTTDVAGIGDEAFYPNDRGPIEIVASADGEIFAVSVFVFFSDPPAGTDGMVADLSRAIVSRLAD
ncbi:MAG TPA: hypothetical protein VGC47_02390 [Acidimicrobiia bacterium]